MSRSWREINALLTAIKKGNKLKQQELHDKTVTKHKVVALTYAEYKNDWEDIVNESYFKAIKYIHTFKEYMDGYNWLCKIVENVARNFNAELENTVSLEQLTFEYIVGDSESIYETDELAIELKKLNPEEQNVIYLHVYAGYSFMEIAALLNSKKSTVYKQFKAGAKIVLENLKNK